MKYGDLTQKILKLVKANPGISNKEIAEKLDTKPEYVSSVRRLHNVAVGRKKRNLTSATNQIRLILEANPEATNAMVKASVPCHVSQISQLRSEMGITGLRYCHAMLEDMNFEFIKSESAKSGVNAAELLNAIVTDARLEG